MKVLVTGGAGYIGTELVHALARQPKVEELIVYDNLSRGNYHLFVHRPVKRQIVRFVRGDILDLRRLKAELKGVDVVFHLAARVSTPFAGEDAHSFEQINHWGCAELAAAIEASDVSQLIYTSSAGVYGFTDEPVDEHAECRPKSHYGVAKLRGEQQIERLAPKLTTHVIRCANVFGFSPSMRFDAVVNRFMFEANYSNRISIYGNGHQARAFLHIDNAVRGLIRLLDGDVPSGTYNLVDANYSVLDLAASIKEVYPDIECIFVDQHMPFKNLLVDPDSGLSRFMVRPKLALAAALKDFASEFAFHPPAGTNG